MTYLCGTAALQQQQVRTVMGRMNGVLCGVIVAALRLLPLRLLSFSLVSWPRWTEGLCFGLRAAVPLRGSCKAMNVILFWARFWALAALQQGLIQAFASFLDTLIISCVLFGVKIRIQEVHLTFAPPQFVTPTHSPLYEGGGHSGATLLQLSSLGIDT